MREPSGEAFCRIVRLQGNGIDDFVVLSIARRTGTSIATKTSVGPSCGAGRETWRWSAREWEKPSMYGSPPPDASMWRANPDF
jgi:hypothetical protein